MNGDRPEPEEGAAERSPTADAEPTTTTAAPPRPSHARGHVGRARRALGRATWAAWAAWWCTWAPWAAAVVVGACALAYVAAWARLRYWRRRLDRARADAVLMAAQEVIEHATAEEKLRAQIARMTLDEKLRARRSFERWLDELGL